MAIHLVQPGLGGLEQLGEGPAVSRPAGGSSTRFSETLRQVADAVVTPQTQAAQAIGTFVEGGDGALHETLLAVEKADISLKFLVSVRTKLLEAYREIMQMGA